MERGDFSEVLHMMRRGLVVAAMAEENHGTIGTSKVSLAKSLTN